jgi:fucose permease
MERTAGLLLKTWVGTVVVSALIKYGTGWVPDLVDAQKNVVAALVVTLPVLVYVVILQIRTDG